MSIDPEENPIGAAKAAAGRPVIPTARQIREALKRLHAEQHERHLRDRPGAITALNVADLKRARRRERNLELLPAKPGDGYEPDHWQAT